MSAGRYDFIIEQGTTFARLFTFFYRSGIKKGVSYDTFGNIISPKVTLVVGTATITRDVGSWIDEGFAVGGWVTTELFPTTANNIHAQVTVVTDLILTLNTTLTVETAVTGASVRRPKDLTACTGAAMLRKKPSSVAAAATFTVTFDSDRTKGIVSVSLSKTQTSAIPCGDDICSSASRYGWDFEITDSTGETARMLMGDEIYVSAERTK